MTETGVGGVICAAHTDPQGRLHGHTYEVRAWFPAGADALELQARLNRALEPFDHAELQHELCRGEALCEAIAEQLPGAIEIEISRPLERIFARWRNNSPQATEVKG